MIARFPDTVIGYVVYVLIGGVLLVGLVLIAWTLAVLLHWLDPIVVHFFAGSAT